MEQVLEREVHDPIGLVLVRHAPENREKVGVAIEVVVGPSINPVDEVMAVKEIPLQSFLDSPSGGGKIGIKTAPPVESLIEDYVVEQGSAGFQDTVVPTSQDSFPHQTVRPYFSQTPTQSGIDMGNQVGKQKSFPGMRHQVGQSNRKPGIAVNYFRKKQRFVAAEFRPGRDPDLNVPHRERREMPPNEKGNHPVPTL